MSFKPHKLERKYRRTLSQLLNDGVIYIKNYPSLWNCILETLGLIEIFAEKSNDNVKKYCECGASPLNFYKKGEWHPGTKCRNCGTSVDVEIE